ncbi:RDD family protein [SAR86 cluster bacterium]|nr:RDD family protein [SAR86 cluster bacterium]
MFFRRLLALFYDLLLIAGILLSFTLLIVIINGGAISSFLGSNLMLLSYFLISFIFYVYFWRFNDGQTLGMQAWKIKLVADDNQAISIKSMLQRLVLGLFFGSIAGLNFFVILFRSDKRSLNDIYSKTKIVRS